RRHCSFATSGDHHNSQQHITAPEYRRVLFCTIDILLPWSLYGKTTLTGHS
ncbi:Uncharacterized protein APZ42_008074, partial [Daphnia magna]